MFCRHPDPKLCERLGRHIFGGLWILWNTKPEWRAKWEAEAPFRIADAKGLSLGEQERIGARPGHRGVPCVRELPVVRYCNDVHNEDRHVRECEIHDRCTRGYVSEEQKACSLCTDYVPGDHPFYWISTQKLMRDTAAFAGALPLDLRGIGGVVR